jgi:hypothetical protein
VNSQGSALQFHRSGWVCWLALHLILFSKEKTCQNTKQLAQIIKTHSPAYIYRQMYLIRIRSTFLLRFSPSGFFWFSRCPSHNLGSYQVPKYFVCEYAHIQTHTATPPEHPSTKDKYKRQNPLSHPCQNSASTKYIYICKYIHIYIYIHI